MPLPYSVSLEKGVQALLRDKFFERVPVIFEDTQSPVSDLHSKIFDVPSSNF